MTSDFHEMLERGLTPEGRAAREEFRVNIAKYRAYNWYYAWEFLGGLAAAWRKPMRFIRKLKRR